MTKIHKQVERLQKEGYAVSDIAEEMGISASRAQKLIDELEAHTTQPSPAITLAQKQKARRLERALDELKDEFDTWVLTLQELDDTTIEREAFNDFLQETRALEYKMRKVARQYELTASGNAHREHLVWAIEELKAQEENFDVDDELHLDMDAELLEQAEDLRFELFELMPLEEN